MNYILIYNIFNTLYNDISNYAWHYYCQLAEGSTRFVLPRYHQIHSTVSWRPVLLCECRRTCYCTSLHTHSRGNTPAETTAVLQHSFFMITVMTLFVARRASPRPRGPAEGRLGPRCYSLLPHIPPVHQISTCCCSCYRSETQRHVKSNTTLFIYHRTCKRNTTKYMHYAQNEQECQYLNAFLFIHFKVNNQTGFTMIGRNDIPSIRVSLTL